MQATLTLPGTEPVAFHLSEADSDPEPTEDDLAAIGRGLADMDAGVPPPAMSRSPDYSEKYGFAKVDKPFDTR